MVFHYGKRKRTKKALAVKKRWQNMKLAQEDKKSRHVITLEQKIDIIQHYEAGTSQAELSRQFGFAESTIRTILNNSDKFKTFSEAADPLNASTLTRTRSLRMEKMEKILIAWLEQNQLNLQYALVMTKAKDIYDSLKAEENEGAEADSFTASRGWFKRFKQRSNLQINISDEDEPAAAQFPQVIIKEGNSEDTCMEFSNIEPIETKYIPSAKYIASDNEHNFSHICNLCFDVNHSLKILATSEEMKMFHDSIKLCLPEIDLPDIPLRLCANCYNQLKIFYAFRQLCTSNYVYLKELCQTRTKYKDSVQQRSNLTTTLDICDTTSLMNTDTVRVTSNPAASKDTDSCTHQIKVEPVQDFQQANEHYENVYGDDFIYIKEEFHEDSHEYTEDVEVKGIKEERIDYRIEQNQDTDYQQYSTDIQSSKLNGMVENFQYQYPSKLNEESSKTPKSMTSGIEEKRSRKVMTLAEKVKILDKLRDGISAAALGREYQVNESTIRTIRKCEEKIRASVRTSAPISAKVSYVSRRNPNIEKMENLLIVWINKEVHEKGSVIDSYTMREKALSFYEYVVVNGGSGNVNDFQASKGWFANFTRRFNLSGKLGKPITKWSHEQSS